MSFNLEQIIKILIYFHAFFGGIGLITGTISICGKKGGINHKKAGKIFSYSMIISSLISLIVARMPNHGNLFLFLIGIFTIYMVLAGNAALTFKSTNKLQANNLDKTISGIMLVISIIMIVMGTVGIIQKINNSILYVFFGSFGVLLTIKDFQTFKRITQNRNAWIKSHIGRMVGALIASVTAFLVAGLNIGTVLVWILPTILGVPYIIYWSRKFKSPGMAIGQ
ncbi:MAG: hypothetical protein ABIW47_04710 [Ginsengibacter sp.]